MIYALAGILLWVGGLKFAAYEADAVQMFAAESPLLSWLYDIFDVRTFLRLLGVAEILAGVAIALRPVVPWASAVCRRGLSHRALRGHAHLLVQ